MSGGGTDSPPGARLAAALAHLIPECALQVLKDSDDPTPFASDAAYLSAAEGWFLLRHNTFQLRKTLHPALLGPVASQVDPADRKAVAARALLDASVEAEARVGVSVPARLALMPTKPRIIRLCERLQITGKEVTALLFIALLNAGVELPTLPSLRPTCAFMARYAALDHRTYLHFLSEERAHFRQGLVGMSDARFKLTLGECCLKMPREVLAALTGAPMSEAELIKLDKSALAAVLAEEGGPEPEQEPPHPCPLPSQPIPDDDAAEVEPEDAPEFDLYDFIRNRPRAGLQDGGPEPGVEEERSAKRLRVGGAPSSISSAGPLDLVPAPPVASPATMGDPPPYATDLEYLGDLFKLLALLIKIRNSEADIQDDDPEFLVQPKTEAEASLREWRGKERVQRRVTERRLAQTQAEGKFQPRVEGLAQQRGLGPFEKMVLVFLVGSVISHDVLIAMNSKYVMRGDDKRVSTVGYLLYVLCDTLPLRVANRSRFYKSAPLVKDGMVMVNDKPSFGDLMDCPVELDRRMLDYLVGLDTEFNEIVEGSHLYLPRVSLDQVILPEEQKRTVMDTVGHFEAFTAAKRKFGMDDVVAYGGGLVLLFYGASGTGKTMFANAIAREVGKKLLLVNLAALLNGKNASGDLLKLIFREAKLYDALIFFDECEGLFGCRTSNPAVTSLLAELERHQGLLVLATNRAQALDDAMQRRITLAIEFKAPDHALRRQIWAKHLPPSMPLHADVDCDTLALDFDLSGGLIKNAVLSALSIAVSREGASPTVTMADLRKGAKLQLRSYFREDACAQRVVPKRSLADAVFHDRALADLQQLISLERGRRLLHTQWGFPEDECTRQSIVALFAGPSGTGKSLAAEIVGYETGALLKVVNVRELGLRQAGPGAREVEQLFEDAARQNAVLVLDDADGLFQGGGQGEELAQLLAYHIARFPRIVLLLIRAEAPLDAQTTPFPFKFRIHFRLPTAAHRARLWRAAIPSQVPLAPDVDFTQLAEQELSGAQIKAAAFFACAQASTQRPAEGSGGLLVVTAAHLLAAVRELLLAARHSVLSTMFI